VQITPYLFFEGRAEEAIGFYREALGAEVAALMRFREAPPMPAEGGAGPGAGPEMAEKVMHAELRIGGAAVLLSDGRCSGEPRFGGVSLTLRVPDAGAAERAFGALAAGGGQVQMPLAETFFAPRFGMVADRFGVSWMVIVEGAAPRT
jgi:PhnB protein